MTPFRPFFRNRHIATIAGNFWRRNLDQAAFPPQPEIFQTAPDIRVLSIRQQPKSTPLGHVILLHGLEGSSESGYMQSMAQAALQAGFVTHRLNMRGCGASGHLSSSLYHAGLTSDLRVIAEQFRAEALAPVYLIGFSLGANVVLKLAGELAESAHGLIAGVCAVSAPVDLAACAQELQRPSNWIYGNRFVSRLKERIREKHRREPARFPIAGLEKVRTVYDFDDIITAPWFGFGTADNYYRTQACGNFLSTIAIPTLMVQSKDDPLIPFHCFDLPAIAQNPHLTLHAVEHGGHLGFIARGGYRFWLDELAVSWLVSVQAQCSQTASPGVPQVR